MGTHFLTKEQYEKLTPYADYITKAYKHSYIHMPGTVFMEVAALYTEITGSALTKSQMGCNTCRLNTLRKLGEMYTNYTEKPKEKKETKRGRPKKLEE